MNRRHRDAPRGYSLVALLVVLTLMNVAVATVLPLVSQTMKRDREAELIFRGLQYAEAIRVFQIRFGRYPVRLEELLKTNPRCIRRLWKDPMTDDGEWAVIFAQAARPGGGDDGRDDDGREDPPPRQRDGRGQRREGFAAGPIVGVHSKSTDEAVRTFFGAAKYSDWHFTVDLIPQAAVVPGQQWVPRPTSDWVGRPFPPDVTPQIGQPQPGQPPQAGQDVRGRGPGSQPEGADSRRQRRKQRRGG